MRGFLETRNAKQSYIAAGYSARAAEVNACNLLMNHKVRAALADGEAEIARRCEVSVDNVVEALRKIAFDEAEATLARLRAFELLGKHIGMWPRVPRGEEAEQSRLVLVSPKPAESAEEWDALVDAELRRLGKQRSH